MYPGVIAVEPINDFKLVISFSNQEKRVFDMIPYFEHGLFKELKDINQFKKVRVAFDSIQWPNGADLDPEILYEEGMTMEQFYPNQAVG
jgi:hypothetical protein